MTIQNLHFADLPLDGYVWVEDSYNPGSLGAGYKIVEVNNDIVTLEGDASWDRYGDPLEGEITEHRLPIRGWVQP